MKTVPELLENLDRLYPDLPMEILLTAANYWEYDPTGTVTVDRSCVPGGRPRWTIDLRPADPDEMRW